MTVAVGSSRRNLRVQAASVGIYNITDAFMVLLPTIVGQLVTHNGLTPSQAGLATSLEMATVAATTMALSRLVRSPRFLPFALTGQAIALASIAGCVLATQLSTLFGLLIAAGIGLGMMTVVPPMAIATLPNPRAAYAQMYMIALIFDAVLVSTLPGIASMTKASPGFPAFIGYSLLLLPIILMMPKNARASVQQAAKGEVAKIAPLTSRMILLAVVVSTMGLPFYGVWAFVVLLAESSGMSHAQSNQTMLFCLAGSIAGSVLIGLTRGRFPYSYPIYAGIAGMGAGLSAIVLVTDPLLLQLSGFLALFSLYILLPSVLGLASEIDVSGRGPAFINATTIFAGAAGPFLCGKIVETFGYAGLASLSVCATAIAVAAFFASQFRGRPNEATIAA